MEYVKCKLYIIFIYISIRIGRDNSCEICDCQVPNFVSIVKKRLLQNYFIIIFMVTIRYLFLVIHYILNLYINFRFIYKLFSKGRFIPYYEIIIHL